MYTKNSNFPPSHFMIPEHYGGSMFSSAKPIGDPPAYSELKKILPSHSDVALQVAKPKNIFEVPSPPDLRPKEDTKKPFLNLGFTSDLLSGMKSDDLLLLGLILLLSKSDGEEEMIPWLALLFFCR